MIFLDVETDGVDPIRNRLHGVGVAVDDNTPNYHMPATLAGLNTQVVVGANVLFDLRFLLRKGILAKLPTVVHDTRMLAVLIDDTQEAGLKELTARYLGKGRLPNLERLKEAFTSAGVAHVGQLGALDLDGRPETKKALAIPPGQYTTLIAEYCLEDVRNTRDLFYVLRDEIRRKAENQRRIMGSGYTMLDYYRNEALPFYTSLLYIEKGGLSVDEARMRSVEEHCLRERAKAEARFRELTASAIDEYTQRRRMEEYEERLAGYKTEKAREAYRANPTYKFQFNSGSMEQLISVLQLQGVDLDRLEKTKTGRPKLGDLELAQLHDDQRAHRELIACLRAMREAGKFLSAFVTGTRGVMHEGRVFPQYNPFVATGRLGCSSPNVQQLPRTASDGLFKGISVRSFYRATEQKVFAHFDASQIELRIAAHLSQDPLMLEAYNEGLDIHKMTAAAMFGCSEEDITDEQRQAGKSTNFLLIYDGSPPRLQTQLKSQANLDFDELECREFRDAFFRRYKRYREYLNEQKAWLDKYCFVVAENGRVRRLPDAALGRYLDRRAKKFTGPPDLYAKLRTELVKAYEPGRCETVFDLARKKYAHAMKQAYNFPVQSLGATITKLAIMELQKQGYKVVCTVHDAIDVELAAAEAATEMPKIKAILESCYKLSVPLIWDGRVLLSFDEKEKLS